MCGAANPKVMELYDSLGMDPDSTKIRSFAGGFVRGHALSEDKTAIIRVCTGKDLNRFAVRVVHDGMPYDGLKARGYGETKTDPLHFQDVTQLHLNWNWRGKSPFVFIASSLNLALVICEVYLRKRCKGIKIHLIDMWAEAWNPKQQRIFCVSHLVRQFGLRDRLAYHSECLVESEVPRACIVETMDDERIPAAWFDFMDSISSALERKDNRREAQKIYQRVREARKE